MDSTPPPPTLPVYILLSFVVLHVIVLFVFWFFVIKKSEEIPGKKEIFIIGLQSFALISTLAFISVLAIYKIIETATINNLLLMIATAITVSWITKKKEA